MGVSNIKITSKTDAKAASVSAPKAKARVKATPVRTKNSTSALSKTSSSPKAKNASKAVKVKAARSVMSRVDESKALDALSLRIKKNPQLGLKLVQRAGIIDKHGKLTAAYQKN